MCFNEVLVDIKKPNLPRICYKQITPELAIELIDDCVVGDAVRADLAECVIGRVSYDGVPNWTKMPFFAPQTRRVTLRNCGLIDPERIEEYLANDGYKALAKVLYEMKPDEVIEEVSNSELRGRGGAGFPTGRKWGFTRAAKGEPKYLVCNADEGDPGAFMDRSVIEGDPHSLLEGMLIAGYACGAQEGYIYCRAEYPLAIRRLKIAIELGACRICIVEIEGGRGYTPACTMPAADDMVVYTETEEIKALRKATLELLFAERNHYCMFCEVSGDCELQALAYRYGIDSIHYKPAYPKLPVDTSRPYFLFDQNRCILCRRCIRACSELAGHNVLGARERGSATMISADFNTPFGESTCVSCGTCLQVCPTGALIDRKSAYLGQLEQCEITKSTCAACSVGCGIEVVTRDNHILRINGDWDAEVNKGILCVAGRFEPLYDGKPRLTQPMIKRNGVFSKVDWDSALDYVAEKFRSSVRFAHFASAKADHLRLTVGGSVPDIGISNAAGLISPRAANEEARLFVDLLGNDKVQVMGPTVASVDGREGALADIHDSDCVLMYKIDLDEEFRVVGSFVKLRVYKEDAKLVLVDDSENSFDEHATLKLKVERAAGSLNIEMNDEAAEGLHARRTKRGGEASFHNTAKELLNQASSPVIIYGTNASAQEVEKLATLCENAKLVGLLPGANSKGLLDLGIDGSADIQNAKALYVLACDDELAEFNRGNADFVVLQTSYFTPEAEKADVLLPSPIWAEREGTFINMDGKVQKVAKIINPPDGVQANELTITRIKG